MNKASVILIIDAVVNYALGILCLLYPLVAQALGTPAVDNAFFPNILGAVLFGIGIALTIECFGTRAALVGLGLGGAVAINLAGGLVLILWLIFGNLLLPLKGAILLWLLAILLPVISLIELAEIVHPRRIGKSAAR